MTDTFNPFATGSSTAAQALAGETNLIYETLLAYNNFKPGDVNPWLASSYQFANGGKTIVFDIRHNVDWSDGVPFTAVDVAYTFNLLLKFPALNVDAIHPTSITENNAYSVTLKFATPQYVNLYLIGTTPIVPEHIWKAVANPVDYTDQQPVGTGPYILSRFSPFNVVFTKNPHYWQPGLPKVATIDDESFDTDASLDLSAEHNQIDMVVGPLEDYQKLFVAPDPAQHVVEYPVINQLEALMVNLKVYPFNMLAVRQAISDALNRTMLSIDGESGQFPPATTPTGLVLPIDNIYMAPAYKSLKLSPTSDVAGAKKVLLGAGFTYNGSHLIMPNGKPFTASITDPAPYSDYVLDDGIIAEELQGLGITVTVSNPSPGAWTADVNDGNFDMAMCYSYAKGPTPYYYFNAELNSTLTAPIGTGASGDIERFYSPEANALLADYANTGSLNKQIEDIQGLEKIMVSQMPLVMVFDQTFGFPYSTKYFTNWPGQSNPYASPLSEQEIIHLVPQP